MAETSTRHTGGTDMSDAPERIWADPPETFDGCDVWHSEPAPERTEYIRSDLAQATIATAYEDAASAVESVDGYDDIGGEHPLVTMIRARTPTDARKALEAYRQQVRAEALRVKPLVWGYHPAGAIAAPPTGHAYIIDMRMKGRIYSIKGFNPQREFASMDEAFDAAQADYEHRVLSALIRDTEGA